jgi:lipopolysaccharide export system permease protein
MFMLWRYILKEHVGPFVFANCVITLVFLLNLVFRELSHFLSRGLEFTLIVEFFFLNMAWILALAIPMSVLVATVMAFGRLSGDNEITAMKASGISILKIMAPVIFASVLCAAFLVWFNNNVLPDFNHRARLLASDIARKRPTLNLEPGVIYQDLANYNILVMNLKETVDTSYVRDVFIEDNSDPNSSSIIFAERGKVYIDPVSEKLNMLLYDGEIHELNLEEMEKYRRLNFGKYRLSIDVDDMFLRRSHSEYRGDREKSAKMLLADVYENKKIISERRMRIRNLLDSYFQKYLPVFQSENTEQLKAALESSGRSFSANASGKTRVQSLRQSLVIEHKSLKQNLDAELSVIRRAEQGNSSLMVEVHKKYSIPVSCIIFVLIGAPLGMMARKGSMAVAGGISFGFFLLYWAMLIGGEELADNQYITPFMAMWTANVLTGAAGVYLILSSARKTVFINRTAIGQFFAKKKELPFRTDR